MSEAYKEVTIGEQLTSEQKSQVEKLLKKNRMAFSTSDEDIGMIKSKSFSVAWHNEEKEVYLRPRPCKPAYKEGARKIMNQWKNMGVIEPTSSRHNIPIFFIPKKGGKAIRPILDCRAVNDETIPNHYPIPHLKDLMYDVSELIGSEGKDRLYTSSTDIQAAYNQMVVDKEDRHKISFSWENRQYQAARCMFGLRNAPSAFCQFMAGLTEGMKNTYVLLDDILILSTSWDEHVERLQELFDRCISEGLTLKPSKTHIASSTVDYLGFKITKDGIKPLAEKVRPILEYPAPKTKKGLRRFLGMTNFYSKFVKRGHQVLAPLYRLSGNEPFRWRIEHMEAFEKYKTMMAKDVQLAHRDRNKPLVLVTDGSMEGLAGGLHQMNENNELEPLGFVSRALRENEMRLSSRYIEFLAIVWSLESFDWELQGQHVVIMTDHKSLERVLEEKEHKEHQPVKIINAHARLAQYDTKIIHRPNTDPAIIALDAFSRAIPMPKMEEVDNEDEKADRGVSNTLMDVPILAPKRMHREIFAMQTRSKTSPREPPPPMNLPTSHEPPSSSTSPVEPPSTINPPSAHEPSSSTTLPMKPSKSPPTEPHTSTETSTVNAEAPTGGTITDTAETQYPRMTPSGFNWISFNTPTNKYE